MFMFVRISCPRVYNLAILYTSTIVRNRCQLLPVVLAERIV